MKKVSLNRLYLLIFLYSLFANFAHPVTPTFIKTLGLHDYMFGLAFACMSFSSFLFSPFWGKMSTKYGSAKVFCFAHLGYGVMQVCFGLSTQEWQICAARFIGGFFISAISVSQLIYIMKNSESDDRIGFNLAKAASLNAMTAPFGFLIGGFIGDFSVLATFIIQGVTLFLNGVLGFMIIKDSGIEDELKINFKDINPFKDFINSRDIITGIIFVFLTIVIFSSFASTCYEQCFNYYIKDQFGFPSSYNGILKACVGFIAMGANVTITRYLLKNTNTFKSIIGVFFVLFSVMIGVVVIEQMVPFIIINVVFFGLNSVYLPLLQNMMTKYRLGERQGELVGLFNAIKSMGAVGGSLFAGFIYAIGPKLSFIYSALAFFICVAMGVLHLNKTKKQSLL